MVLGWFLGSLGLVFLIPGAMVFVVLTIILFMTPMANPQLEDFDFPGRVWIVSAIATAIGAYLTWLASNTEPWI